MTKEEIEEILKSMKVNNKKYDFLFEHYDLIRTNLDKGITLRSQYDALFLKQALDEDFKYSSFRNYFYMAENDKANAHKKNKQKIKKPKTTSQEDDSFIAMCTKGEVFQFEKLMKIKNHLLTNKCFNNQQEKDDAIKTYNNSLMGKKFFSEKIKTDFECIVNFPINNQQQ